MYRGGQRGAAFSEGDLVLSSWSGFHLEEGRLLTVSKDGEMFSIFPSVGGFGEADRIEATLGFERLGVASHSACEEKKSHK